MAGGRIDYTVGFKVDTTQLNNLKSQLQQLSASVNQLTVTGNSATGLIGTQKVQLTQQEINQVKTSLTQLEGALTKAFNTQLGTLNITKFNQELKGLNLTTIQSDMARLGAQGQNAFRSIAAAALSTNMQLKQSHTFLRSMADTMVNTLKWGVASSVMNTFSGSVKKAYGYVKELDKSLNDIRIVTKQSAEDMEEFARQANKAAKELHASTTAYTQAALIYAQQGLEGKELEARTNVTMKVANVTGVDAEEASEYLTAVWNGYKVSAEETEVYVDKLANVAAHTASNLEELSTGMSKVASAANIMGVDVDQLNAQLSTIISVTREAPETIGTSLKTVYARMADIEAGLDEETTLGNYTSEMADLGINVLNAQGKIRDMGDVIEEIGEKWSGMSREQQIALARTIAGQRQYSRMLSLFDNWDKYNEALEYSKTATGELQAQQDIYSDSIEAHLANLQAATQGIYANLMDADGLNPLIDNLTSVVELFDNFIDVIGGGKGALQLLGIVIMKIFGQHMVKGLTTFITNVETASFNAKQMAAEMKVLGEFEQAANKSEDAALKQIVSMKKQALEYSKSLTAEEREAVNQMIQQTEELYKQRDALKEEQSMGSELLTRRTVGKGDKPIDLTTSKGIEDAQKNLSVTKDVFSEQEKDNSAFLNALKAEEQAYLTNSDSIETLTAAKKRTMEATTLYISQLEKSAAAGQMDDTFKKNSIQLMQTLKDQISEYNRLEQEQISIEEQINSLKEKGNLTDEEQIKLQELENEQIKIGNKLKNQYSSIQVNTNKLRKQSTDALKREGKAIKDTEKSLQTLDARLKENEQGIENAKASFENFVKTLSLKNAITNIMNFTQGISSAVMGINSLRNAWSALKDPNLEGWEKFSQIMLGISMGFPMIVSGFTKMGSAIGSIRNTILGAKAAADAYNIAQGTSITYQKMSMPAKALYSKLLDAEAAKTGVNKEAIDSETKAKLKLQAVEKTGGALKSKNVFTILKETIATKANSVANWWNAASQAAKFWYVTLIIAAITALIALTVALTRSEDEETKALQAANERLDEANQKYEAATKAVNAFKEALSNYDEGIKALKELDSTTEEYKEKLEEVNAQARELIETYGLFDDYTIDAVTGAIKIDDDALKGVQKELEGKQTRASISKLMAESHVISAQLDVDSKTASKNVGNKVSYTAYTSDGDSYTSYRNMTTEEIQSLGKAMSELKTETNGVKLSDKQLIEKIRDNKDEYNLSTDVMNNLNSLITNETVDGLWNFVDTLDTASEANLRYAEQILKAAAKDVYGEKATELATDEETGEVDAVLESLLTEAAGAAAARSKDEAGKSAAEKEAEWNKQAKDIIDNHDSNWDDQQGLEDSLATFAKDLGLNVNNVQQEMFGYDGKNDVQAHTLYKRYLESKGFENVTTSDKLGKVEYSYYDPNNKETVTDTISNELAGEAYAREFTTVAIEMASKNIAKDYMSEEDFAKIGENVRDTNDLYGADWTNVLLSSAATGKDLDLSSLFGEFTQAEVDALKNMSGEELQAQLNLSDEAMDMLDLTQKSLNEQVDASLKKYDEETHQKAADDAGDKKAEKLGLDIEELDAYRKILAEENEELAENRDALNEVAIANKRMEKGVKTLAGDWESLDEIMSDSTSTAEDISSILPTVNEGLQDILNLSDEQFELLPPNFAKDNWNIIQDVMNGVEGAVDRLRDVAGQEILLDVKGAVDENGEIKTGVSRLHEYIASMDNMNFEIGAAIDDTEFLARCQDLVNTAGMTQDQVSGYFGAMGYDVEFDDNPQKVQEQVVDLTYKYDFDDEGNPIKRYATPEYRKVETEIDAPTIKTITPNGSYGGNTSVKTTAPKTATSGKSKGGGGGSKKKSEKIDKKRDAYKTINSKIKQTENDLVKLEKERERLSGGKLIQNLNKQLKNLEQQKKLQEEKLQIAYEEERKLRQEIQQAGEDGYAFGIQFDAEGNIINYDQIAEQELAALKAATDKFNASAQEEADQEAYDKAKERYEKFEELIDEYYELHDNTISDIENQIQDLYDQVIEMQVEKFTMDIELQTNFADIKNEWLELRDSILYSEKAFGQTAITAMSGLKDSMAGIYDTLADVEYMQGELAKIKAGQNSDLFGNNEKIANETINDTIETTQEWVENSLDYIEVIEEAAISAMEEIIDLQSQMIDSYENLISTLEHKMSLKELIGGDAADTTEELQETFNIQLDIAKTSKKNLDDNRKYLAENGEWLKENNPEEYLNYVNNVLEAEEQVFSSVEEAITTLNDLFDKGIENMLKEVETAYAGALGWEELSTRWENDQELADLYLTSVQKEYELQKMLNKVNQDILDKQYDSIYAQQKLNDFKENYIKMLEKEGDLTQAQVDRMNKMYELTLLQIALEEAKNNKSSMKLTRDSQGNYVYQYTTDEAEVAKREQELADKKNEIYKQDIEDTKSAISDYISAGKDAQSEYMDLFESEEFKRYMELSAESVGKELTPEEQAELDAAREKAYDMLAERAQTSAKQMEAQRKSTLEGINNILKDVELQEIDWTQDYDTIVDNLDENQLDALLDAGIDLKSSAFKSLFGFNSNTYLQDILSSENGVWNGYLNAVGSYGNNLEQVLQAVGSESLDSYYDNVDLIYQEVQKLQEEISRQSQQAADEFSVAEGLWEEAIAIKQRLEEDMEEGGRLDQIMGSQLGTLYDELIEIKKELGKQTELLNPNGGDTTPTPTPPAPTPTPTPPAPTPTSPQGNGSPDVGDTVTYVSGRYWSNASLSGSSGTRGLGKSATITKIAANGRVHIQANGGAYGWVDISQISGYDTGGYTGSWFNGSKDGRLAMLHQKELILNEKDTPKILDAVKLVREISAGSIIKDFEAQMRNTLSSLENQLIGTYANIEGMAAAAKQSTDQMLEQAVHIDASFPGVKDAREIEEALNNLVNVASQYAYENNK